MNKFPLTIPKCSRCGGIHENLQFVALGRPYGAMTHWATCPMTGEPVLIGVSEAIEVEAPKEP